jgi:hypothetical protein
VLQKKENLGISSPLSPGSRVPGSPLATHKDVKEGGFKAVVNDLLLQVFEDTCVGLRREDKTRSVARTKGGERGGCS